MELILWLLYLIYSTALCWTDVRYGLLPDRLTLPMLWCGLLYHALYKPDIVIQAIFGAVAGYISLWILYWLWRLLRHQEGIGFGDLKLLAALGAWHGWQTLPWLVSVAALLGLGVACGRKWVFNLPQAFYTPLCFGPMLIGASLITMFVIPAFRTSL